MERFAFPDVLDATGRYLAAVVIATNLCFASAQAAPSSGSPLMAADHPSADAPSPASIWNGVLRLIAARLGAPDKEAIERNIGIAFAEEQAETSPPTIGAPFRYSGSGHSPELGEYHLALFASRERSLLVLRWTSFGKCVKVDAAKEDLLGLGWAPGGPRPTNPEAPGRDFFPATPGPHRIATGPSLTLLTVAQASPCISGVILDLFSQAK